ncbi:hypothetical protein CIRG_02484 [Coccidioides immitis RMSCC 2394]|uniref:Extracellular membrane protein CFEM domain-containing protein n=1 Tax=Coccidioides immitis RMSCC 2394 TaxID=404692 RepID=A0A0J7AZ78_COCIT|nr:hypothetical protein CIRG_02484 [Coccidioides immitis RMSCC 2394]
MRLLIQILILSNLLRYPNIVAGAALVPRAGQQLVQDIVPPCSLSCLKDFISHNYPTSICSDTKSLGCLCTQKSRTGYAFGEAALQCVLASCPSPKDREFGVYNVCRDVFAAVPNTHTAIIATLTPSHTVPHSSHIGSMETSKITMSIISSTKDIAHEKTRTNITPTALATSTRKSTSTPGASHESKINADASMSFTLSSSMPAQTTVAIPSGSLPRNQIIGISVGVGAACLFGIGLLAFFVLCWRRCFQRRKNELFEIGGTMAEPSPRLFRKSLPRIPSTPVGAYNRSTFEPLTSIPGLRFHSGYQSSDFGPGKRPYTPSELAETDDIELESPSSMRTVSRLLPDKPDLETVVHQHPITEKLASARPSSAVTIFEEDADYRRSNPPEEHLDMFKSDCDLRTEGGLWSRGFPGNNSFLSPEVRTHPNTVKFTNPFAGVLHTPVDGTASPQIPRKGSVVELSSLHSSSHPQLSGHVDCRKTDSHIFRMRHSVASSTTSFETTASDEEGVNTRSSRATTRLSPVEESDSKFSPSKYLQVPPAAHYSHSVRGRNQWNPRPLRNGDSHNNPRRQPSSNEGNHTLEPGPCRPRAQPASYKDFGCKAESSAESAGNLSLPVNAHMCANLYIRPSRRAEQGLAEFNSGYGHEGRASLWERKLDPPRRGPRLVLRTD